MIIPTEVSLQQELGLDVGSLNLLDWSLLGSLVARLLSKLSSLQVIVVGVLCHPPVDEGPGQVINSVLLVLDRLGDNLSIEVIVEAVVQVRLCRKWLVEELLEEVLLRSLAKQDTLSL